MKRGAHRTLALAGASLLLGCARLHAPEIGGGTPAPDARAPARLTVDVYGGLDARGAASSPSFEFRVIAADDPARVLAYGRTGGGAVAVPPGVLMLLVRLDPIERIGPFRLEPGDTARIRILDTLDAGLPSRIWRLERGDEVVGHAFPPPDELPADETRGAPSRSDGSEP